MSKKYKLAISNVVVVPVEVKINDETGKAKTHKFSVTCNRLGADDLAAAFAGVSPQEFLTAEVTAWSGQKLVLEDDGTPAEFCADSLAALLDIQGMVMVIFGAYLKEAAATAKN